MLASKFFMLQQNLLETLQKLHKKNQSDSIEQFEEKYIPIGFDEYLELNLEFS